MTNGTVLQIVMTHSEAKETTSRHTPYWERISKNIVFVSPKDKFLFVPGFLSSAIGKAEHHGELSASRIEQTFEMAKLLNWDTLFLYEYDALITKLTEDILPPAKGISAPVYRQNKPIKFKARFYTHYPMIFTREGFDKTYETMKTIKGGGRARDREYSDRFIGLAIQLAGIPVKNLFKNRRAFTKNTIRPHHYKELRFAVNKEGASCFHGVKDLNTLIIIVGK